MLLVLCLFAFDPPEPPVFFTFAVEDWIAEVAGPERIHQALTPDDLADVRRLGSASYLQREHATRRLAERGTTAIVALVWAARSRDAEIRQRGRMLLGRLGIDRGDASDGITEPR